MLSFADTIASAYVFQGEFIETESRGPEAALIVSECSVVLRVRQDLFVAGLGGSGSSAIERLRAGEWTGVDSGFAELEHQDFFTLWKDVDPDIPIRQQAKAEYARLN